MFLYVNGLQALSTKPLPPSKSTFYYTPYTTIEKSCHDFVFMTAHIPLVGGYFIFNLIYN